MSIATNPSHFQGPIPHSVLSPCNAPQIGIIRETPKDEMDDNIHGQERLEAVGGNTVSHYDPDLIESINFSTNTFIYQGQAMPLAAMAKLIP